MQTHREKQKQKEAEIQKEKERERDIQTDRDRDIGTEKQYHRECSASAAVWACNHANFL